MSIKIVDIGLLKPNPSNPRHISDGKFKQLVKSIRNFPEMLNLRPIVVDADYVVLGGNMRLKACIEAGLIEVPIIMASELTKEQQSEFIIKDNVGFGEWDWEELANAWEVEELAEWGLDLPIEQQIDELQDGEGIELPQSVQLEPPKEYIIIIANANSIEWEEIKETLKLKMVRRGGYKKDSAFDAVSLERVIEWEDFKERIYVDSGAK
jgi:ParB-like chromosome segregation protein Spo0J